MRSNDRALPISDDATYQLGLKTGQWLIRLRDTHSPQDQLSLEQAEREFREWCARSPRHTTLFLETVRIYRSLGNIDPDRRNRCRGAHTPMHG
jgi:ferric-dicitrate binding protein FerR (iron transport regulator)